MGVMLDYENKVANYVESTGNHVLYRATPVYEGDNLLAGGVQLEAYSVEDKGKGVCFNVYCYNVQPDIVIDYSDGSSKLSDNAIVSIKLSYSKYSLKVGQSKTLVATTSPEKAAKSVKWYSSNNKIATVNNKGKVTAKKAGTVTITAKTTNGLKATCKITVKANTVVVDNSEISTGGSSLKAVDALRQAGCEVVGMVASYTYGFPVAEQAFAEAGVKLVTLTDYEHVVAQALETGYIAETDVEVLNEWRKDPANWKK